jgi:hypothetical protein
LALEGGGWSSSCPSIFTPCERTQVLVGPRARLYILRRGNFSCSCFDLNPRLLAPVLVTNLSYISSFWVL